MNTVSSGPATEHDLSLHAMNNRVQAMGDTLQRRYGPTPELAAFRQAVRRAVNTAYRASAGEGNVPTLDTLISPFCLEMLRQEIAEAVTACLHAHGETQVEMAVL